MSNIDLSAYIDTNQYELHAIRASWINPHATKLNTPVQGGGLVWSAESGLAVGERFSLQYSGGEKQDVYGGAKVWLHPIYFSPTYNLVISRDGSLTVPYYGKIDRARVPDAYRVISARDFYFTLKQYPTTLLVVTFRSTITPIAYDSYTNAVNRYWALCLQQLQTRLVPAAIPFCLEVAEVRMVGKEQKSPVAIPRFTFDADKPIAEQLVPRDVIALLVEYQKQLKEQHDRAQEVVGQLPWDRAVGALPSGEDISDVVEIVD